MSWLGNGLSQITGQISTFTKEVLTEGTEEIDDVPTQLKVTSNKVQQLEALCAAQKAELERVQRTKDEAEERQQASELQLTALSQQYRDNLTTKEREVVVLKGQLEQLEPAHQPVVGTHHAAHHGLEDFASGFEGEAEGLRAQLRQLATEKRHLQETLDAVNRRQQETDARRRDEKSATAAAGETADDRHSVKALRSQLEEESNRHHEELTATQNLHQQKISQLKRKHRDDIRKYEEQINELQEFFDLEDDDEESGSGAAARRLGELHSQVRSLEEQVEKAAGDLEAAQAADRAKAKHLMALQLRCDEAEKLKAEHVRLQQREQALAAELEQAKESIDLNSTPPLGAPDLPTSTPIKGGRPALNCQEGAIRGQAELEQQLCEVRAQQEAERADWLTEKDALEQVLLQLRQQLAERDQALNVIEAAQDHADKKTTRARKAGKARSKGLRLAQQMQADEDEQGEEDLEEDIVDLDEQVELLTRCSAQLENERDILLSEKKLLREDLETNKGKVAELEEKLKALTDSLPGQLDVVQGELKVKTEALEAINAQLRERQEEGLNHSVGEADRTDDLFREVEELKEQLAGRERELADMSLSGQQVEELREENTSLLASLEELDTQNQEAMAHIIRVRNDLQKDNQALKANLTELQTQLEGTQNLQEENATLSEKMNTFEEEKLSLSQQLNSLGEEKDTLSLKVDSLEQEKVSLCQKVTGLEQASSELNKEMESLQKAGNEDEASKAQADALLQEMQAISEQLTQTQTELKRTHQEKQEMEAKLSDMADKYEKGAVALNDLHMTKQEQGAKIDDLKKDLARVSDQAKQTRLEKEDFERQVSELSVRLATAREESRLLRQSAENQEQSREVLAELEKIRGETEQLRAENVAIPKLKEQLEALEEDLKVLEEMKEDAEDRASSMEENLIQQASELQVREEKKEAIQKGLIETLKSQVASAEGEKKALDKKASELEEKLAKADMSEEIASLKAENGKLSKQLEEESTSLKAVENEYERLKAVEIDYAAIQKENEKIKEEIVVLRNCEIELETLKNNERQSEHIQQNGEQPMNDAYARQKAALEKRLSSKEAQLEEQKKIIKALKETVVEHEATVTLFKDNERRLASQQETIEQLEASLAEKERALEEKNWQLEKAKSLIDDDKKDVLDKDPDRSGESSQPVRKLPTLAEVQDMKSELSRKDNLVQELQGKCQCLQSILDQEATTAYTAAEAAKVEQEAKALRSEKEQMMSVLTGKTREASQLKSEVHRLMSIVSAEKTALAKLQQENSELRQRQQQEGPHGDMTKEAVKKLSALIRDKDLEMEALGQKNASLLQVLQETSQQGAALASLIQERDNLHKQVNLFQSDREQIIKALNAKHQESLAYHGEVQRLNAVITSENEKTDKLQQEFANLSQQYEDKQQSLLNAQNELLNYKQKYAEANRQYRQMQERQAEELKNRRENADGQNQEEEKKEVAAQNHATLERDRESKERQAQQEQHIRQLTEREEHLQAQVQKLEQQVQHLQQHLSTRERLSPEGEKAPTPREPSPAPVEDEVDAVPELPQPSCDHEAEIESLRSIIQSQEDAFCEKDRILADKDALIAERDKNISEQTQNINDKEKAFSELNVRFHKTEQMLRTRDTELGGLKKQVDNLSFRLTGLDTELTDVKGERERMIERIPMLEQEVSMLKEANNKLSMSVNDKDFEINALKEKSNTLGKLLGERKGGEGSEKGEMDRLMKETETLHQQAQAFKQDRDQFILALQQQQSENADLKAQMAAVREERGRLAKEVERLRGHLLAVEDGYTKDALAAEEREKDLRLRLAAAEERALQANTSVQSASQQAQVQVSALQEQLSMAVSQRDEALQALAISQQQTQHYASSLANLQMVLDQFTHERNMQQAAETERLSREVARLQRENAAVAEELLNTHAQLVEATSAVEAAARLSEQLDRKEELISVLRGEVQTREGQLAAAEQHVAEMTAAAEGRVEKALMRNLLVGYFHTPAAKRGEALRVLGHVLDMSPHEIAEVEGGGPAGGGWLGGLIRRVTPTPPSTPRKTQPLDSSFSELFIKYLERESTPTPAMRLPADRMAAEQQQSRARKPAFNPFATGPAPHSPSATAKAPTLPLTINTGREPVQNDHFAAPPASSSHLLMKPVASALPVFAPSRDTVPANSSTILKDVLQS